MSTSEGDATPAGTRPTNYSRISRDLASLANIGLRRVPDDPGQMGQELMPTEPTPSWEESFTGTVAAVGADIVYSLNPAFVPAVPKNQFEHSKDVLPDFNPTGPYNARLLGNREEVVAWRYTAAHVEPYLGIIQATNRVITFDGVTVVHRGTGRMTRYIDWNFVMAQLGIVGSQRPMLGDQPDEDGVVRPVPREPGVIPAPIEEPPRPAWIDRFRYWLSDLIRP